MMTMTTNEILLQITKILFFTSIFLSVQFSSVQSLSCVWLCDPMDCSIPGLPVHRQLPEFTQTHVHWVSDAIQPSHPLSSPSPPAFIFPSISIFSKESILHIRWPKYWSFSISPSNQYPGLISFTIDWFDLAVQGILNSLLQHLSLKVSILQRLAFLWPNSHIRTWLMGKPKLWLGGPLSAK